MRRKKFLSFAFAIIIAATSQPGYVYATKTNVYTSNIGNGIKYSQQMVKDGNVKKLVNIVDCDLKNNGNDVIFSKAKDIEKKEEVLSKQIDREVYKGNNIVAGINADMFDMGIGFSSGPQIINGAILTNHAARSEESIYPVFGIDNNKKAFIDYIHMDAKLTVESTTSGAIDTTPQAIGAANTITIDSINRDNCKDRIVLDNYQLNEDRKVDITPYISKGKSAITVIKGIYGPIKLGSDYEGVIEEVGFGSTVNKVPEDGVLLCSTGSKADWMKNNLKVGDKVKIRVDYNRKNIKQVIGAYTYFLQNGRALSNDEMISKGANPAIVYAKKARTAIGITSDNKVIAITVDAGEPSKGISSGITLQEMASLLKSYGAVNGVSFDGGGSTQMNIKKYGESVVETVNKPSDGKQRSLTNGIMFVSNNERSYRIASIALNGYLNIFKNSSYKFLPKGMDTKFNRLNLNNSLFNWKTSGGIGSINSNGVFKAANGSYNGKVTVKIGNIKSSVNVKVLSTVIKLRLNYSGTVPIQTNSEKKFSIDAKDGNGKNIVIDSKACKWVVSPNIGMIDKNGLLKVKAKSGSGFVTVSVGGKKASVKVSIMQDAKLIDDFEHGDAQRYMVNGSIGGIGEISSDTVKNGKYSYKLSYNYDDIWDHNSDGTINIVPTYTDMNGNDITGLYTSTLRPKKLSMWIYGDGNAPGLYAAFDDGNGDSKTINIVNGVDWRGWKYIEADIPKDIPYPITLSSLYFLETDKLQHKKGEIFIDDLKYVNSEGPDFTAPSFSDFTPVKAYASNSTIKVKISDRSGIDKKSIVAKIDGVSIPVNFDQESGILSYYAQKLYSGYHKFEVSAADTVGNVTNPPFSAIFSVSLEKDSKGPVISNLLPSNNSVVMTQTPRISVQIKDDKAGVEQNNINISMDGAKLNVYYDEGTGYAFAIPDKLKEGFHKLSVSASDRSGNVTTLQPIYFRVKPIIQPRNPNNFIVSLLSDSQGTEFGNEFIEKAGRDNSELVIQNGDFVDQSNSEKWKDEAALIASVGNKPVMISPGESEAPSGNINDFNRNFGLSTYSFEFGNALFISLNSSIGQSITSSDPTQFDYLKRILSVNTKKHVLIYTHVPTRDVADTGYVMPSEDVKKLEGILSQYKENNKNRTVNVIFGHSHCFSTWKLNGVDYAIDGNESVENYVDVNKGGYLVYTQLEFKGNGVFVKYIPIPSSIAIMDDSMVNRTMKLIKGESKNLKLFGDFSDLSADYIALINNVENADITWKSDNPSSVSISQNGIITGKSEGEANIEVVSGNRTYVFKVKCMGHSQNMLSGIKVSVDKSTFASDTDIKLSLLGFDIYGDSFSINNSGIKWSVTKGSIVSGIYKAPKDLSVIKTVTITAHYEGYTSSIEITKNLKDK